jgi:hypothetical protein
LEQFLFLLWRKEKKEKWKKGEEEWKEAGTSRRNEKERKWEERDKPELLFRLESVIFVQERKPAENCGKSLFARINLVRAEPVLRFDCFW